MTTTFYCYHCHKHRPLADVAFRKDSQGRNRRVCTTCSNNQKGPKHV